MAKRAQGWATSVFVADFEQGPAKTAVFVHRLQPCPGHQRRPSEKLGGVGWVRRRHACLPGQGPSCEAAVFSWGGQSAAVRRHRPLSCQRGAACRKGAKLANAAGPALTAAQARPLRPAAAHAHGRKCGARPVPDAPAGYPCWRWRRKPGQRLPWPPFSGPQRLLAAISCPARERVGAGGQRPGAVAPQLVRQRRKGLLQV